MSSMRRLAIAVLMVLATRTVLGQENMNHARGFEPGKMYQFNGIDNVALFNGNLTINIPIGQSYPVNANLSYALHLVYNGQLWKYTAAGSQEEIVANPMPSFNAGLGWMLSLGELRGGSSPNGGVNGWVYTTPEGS